MEINGKSNNGRGGARPGSGRKSNAVRALRDAFVAEKGPYAEYAFKLHADIMLDEKAALDLRLQCGQEVMNRVWGKPRQAVEHSGPDGGPVLITTIEAVRPGLEFDDDRRLAVADPD